MKFKLFKNKKSHVFLILFFGFLIHFLLVYRAEKSHVMEDLDDRLLKTAQNIKYYLEEDYINKNLSKDTYTTEEAIKMFSDLQDIAVSQDVDYIYILIKDGDDIVYAALSDYEEVLREDGESYYWYSLSDTGDDSLEETWDAFDRDEPLYINSTDEWDSYRSVYLTETAPDGTKYIAGVDMTIDNINEHTLKVVLEEFEIFLFTFVLILISLSLFKKKKSVEKKLIKEKSNDSLTDTFNKKYGIKLLKDKVQKEKSIQVFFTDIRSLKKINSEMGLDIGDRVIKIFSNILKRSIRKSDEIIRIEGDKFLVIFSDFPNASRLELINTLKKRIDYFNKNNSHKMFIDYIYSFKTYRGEEVESFIDNIHKEVMNKKVYANENEIEIIQDMFEGISRDEFQVYYQPKINVFKEKVSYEALIRWNHPKKGLIFPNDFIEIAERSILINEITIFVLKKAIEHSRRLDAEISINISPVAFENELFIKDVIEILSNNPDSKNIIFEITEGLAIVDFENTLSKINTLIHAGIRFSIDDFGTGYSSLGYLQTLPINEVKIDKSFVDELETKPVNSLIIKFICELGSQLKLNVVIEGVEEEKQILNLIELGGQVFQGYYFDKPQPIEVIEGRKAQYLEKIKKIKSQK